MDAVLKHFGKRLKAARLRAGFSQSQLAQMLNVGQDTISNYENGRYIPDIVKVIKLTKILGVSLLYFFPDERSSVRSTEETQAIIDLLPGLELLSQQYILELIELLFAKQSSHSVFQKYVLRGEDPFHVFLKFLERELKANEVTLPARSQTEEMTLMILMQFTSIFLIASELEKSQESNEFTRRMRLQIRRLVVVLREALDKESQAL
jgi:transcriptional regulator with XRE-family HTH domain